LLWQNHTLQKQNIFMQCNLVTWFILMQRFMVEVPCKIKGFLVEPFIDNNRHNLQLSSQVFFLKKIISHLNHFSASPLACGKVHNLSMKQGCLFCFSDLPNDSTSCHVISIFGKLSMSRGALTWFEIVWSYGVETIDYWIIFLIKNE
jgi:hypothetical protein